MQKNSDKIIAKWLEDKGLKKNFPYLVIGDGIILKEKIIKALKLFGATKQPIPEYFYASTKEEAEKIADKMKVWHEEVFICKIEKVYKKGEK